jgi:hypothetical protein
MNKVGPTLVDLVTQAAEAGTSRCLEVGFSAAELTYHIPLHTCHPTANLPYRSMSWVDWDMALA